MNYNSKIGFLVQARLGSTRLPQKIIRPFFQGKSILELMVEKLKQFPEAEIIIATSLLEQNNKIENLCNNLGVNCFRGNENDVLKRFIDAAQKFSISKIIRVCSDNPFLDIDAIDKLLEMSKISDADYISFDIAGTPSIKTHFGFWTEYVTLGALKKVQAMTDESIYHEHVTNYIYSHPDSFNIKWIKVASEIADRKDIRLTIDTQNDFDRASNVYEHFNGNPVRLSELIRFLDQDNYILEGMKQEIIRNSK